MATTSNSTPSPAPFIDLLSDYGFKRVFGSNPNKDLLIDFLNDLFQGRKHIREIKYTSTELLGDNEKEGLVVFDLLCTGDHDEKFLIEVQRAEQDNFAQRAITYVSRLISEQVPKGKRKLWEYNIDEVYFIAILEAFSLQPDNDRCLRSASIRYDETFDIFYEGLQFIFVELCNFAKEEDELKSGLEHWFYYLKNISKMDKMPEFFQKPIFEKLFQVCEYAKMQPEEKVMYDMSMRHKWNHEMAMNFGKRKAREEGLAEGREKGLAEGKAEGKAEGIQELVSNLIIKSSLTDNQIAEIANMSVNAVKAIREDLKKNRVHF